MSLTSLVLASSSDEWEARVRKAFDGRLNGDVRRVPDLSAETDWATAAELLTQDDPYVVVLGPGVAAAQALRIARAIDAERPDVCVVLVADPTPELWQGALRAGVRDVVAADAALIDLRATLDRALDTASRRRAALPVTAPPTSRAQVIAVVSPKGGAGKTAVATNLAVGLARRQPDDVVLVDLDLQFGDVAHALRLVPESTIADVSRSLGSLDATSLKAFLTPHPSGLFALCSPDTPAQADDVTTESVPKMLELLSSVFPYVVVDTAGGLDEVTLTTMDQATDLILVCATDVASARAARKELDAFDQLGFTQQERHLVLNRADARVGLNVGDIEATVGLPVDVSVPSSRAVPISMNQGSPLLEQDQRSPVSRAFTELVGRFRSESPATPAPPAAGGLLRRRKEHR
jgi:pilus assembly protein CpaE